ncbi:hypothetical protein [Bdellovibrio sp. HCB337]|uniref:hypothetical protein n=1 Tax=Bdellovibrio sp. HCB337 TaxID=3394358 RepID=UPI0039A65FF4
MNMKIWTQLTAIVMLTAIVSSAKAQSVSFENISDRVPGRNYNPASTMVDSSNANKLLIGIHSGYDLVTWTNTAFIASTGGFHTRTATDTFNVDIIAPAGYSISRIIYKQTIANGKTRIASFSSNLSWTIDGVKRQLLAPATGGVLTSIATFSTEVPKTSARVSLDSTLSATDYKYITPNRFVREGSAYISISSPSLEVELVASP